MNQAKRWTAGVLLACAGTVLVDLGALILGAVSAQVFGWTLVVTGFVALTFTVPVAGGWFE